MTQDNQVGSGGGRLEIQTARSRLEEAAQTLRKRPRQDLIAALGELLDRFQDGESSWHEALLAKTVKTSGFSRATVAAGLELALKDWTHSSLTAMVEQELGSLSRNTGPPPSGCSVTSLILAGVIPMPNLLNTLLPLLVGSPVLVKPSSRDPHTPELVARCLSDIDPQWGRCIEVVPFPSQDREAMQLFLDSPCVMASGSDETIEQIRHQLSSDQRFVAYGHKFSVAVVDSICLLDADQREEIAAALAVDISLWDQLGCLSPAAIYVLGTDADQTRLLLLDSLAEKLARRAATWPRGEATKETRAAIRRERDEAEMRSGTPGGPDLRGSLNSDWTVIAEDKPQWRATPLHRFVRLYPVSDSTRLSSVLEPMRRHLSSAALAGFELDSAAGQDLTQTLRKLGFSRLCAPGRMQAPPLDWHHDGRAVLEPLIGENPVGSTP